MEALDGGLPDRSVHPFDLAVGPLISRLGEAMIDVGESAPIFEWTIPEASWFSIYRPTLLPELD